MNEEGITQSYVGEWRLDIGIGIHWGKVIMGNIGSEKKMDFTIMGDPVNIASRLEALSKQLGKRILLSSSAYELIKDEFEFISLGEFKVMGVEEPLNVYTIKDA